MSLTAFTGSVELGLIYALLAMGLFISFRILDIADLTVDGSFTLGAACSVTVALSGHPTAALFCAFFAGAAAGLVTSLLQTKLKITPILAGILTMTGLYSINLRIMGNMGNVALLGTETVFTKFEALLNGFEYSKMLLGAIIMLFILIVLAVFFKTQLGISIRATGDNPDMVRSSSINTDFTKSVGLCTANALVALSGGMLAQYQMFADINMGTGMVVIALASVIIGEVLIGTKSVTRSLIAVCFGAVIYRIITAFVLRANVAQSDLKIISAVIVAIALSLPAIRSKFPIKRQKRAKEVK